MNTKNFGALLSLLWLFTGYNRVQAYSQISTYGSGSTDEGPRIFKALNADLIFPKTFNSTANVISTTQAPQIAITPQTPQTHSYITEQNSNSAATSDASVIYVTPPSETAPALPIHNDHSIELNQPPPPPEAAASDQIQSDYSTRQHSYGNMHRQQQFASTGRAVDSRPAYQLDQFINGGKPNSILYGRRPTPKYTPISLQTGQAEPYRSNNVATYLQNSNRPYPRPSQTFRRPPSNLDIYNLNGKDQISDRFTPGEAVASAIFKNQQQQQQQHHHHHHHNDGNKIAASSNTVQSYVPPKDLYAFPPNLKAKYPKPSDDPRAALPSSSINSYAPPPAGPISSEVNFPLATAASNSDGYNYKGPFNPTYLPPSVSDDDKTKDAGGSKPSDGDDQTDDDDTIGVLPASAMDAQGGDNMDNTNSEGDGMGDMGDMNPLPIGDLDHDHVHDHIHDHIHDHHHDHPPIGYDTGKEYPTPPPGWIEEHPDHDHGPIFPHHFPDIIYDDHFHDHHHHDFHHDFHHDHPIELPSSTLPPPPPPEPLPSEEPQEPRVKKYSYFYIGRKLWYIPLYFTVWFSFYVLWLIIKSIARHKVNLPNHVVSRRSLPETTDAAAKEYINQLTLSVLKQIDDFQRKHLA